MKFRRLTLAALTAAGSATCAWAQAAPEPVAPADLILRNGAVYTVDAARSWARSVAVRDGRIQF